MKKGLLLILLLAVASCVLYLTNPSREEHRRAVTPRLESAMQEVAQESLDVILHKGFDVPKLLSQPIGTLGRILLQTVGELGLSAVNFIYGLIDADAEQLSISQFIEVEDYHLFSIGYFKCDDISAFVSLGICGKVFVVPQDNIESELREEVNMILPASMNLME